jgi:filamentous hemagglutinin family protein
LFNPVTENFGRLRAHTRGLPFFCRGTTRQISFAALLLSGIVYGGGTGFAQVVLDGKFGTSGALAGPNYTIPANVGATRGNNLFHSFAQFDLAAGDVATFTGPANIQNILCRVTGNAASSINGTISSGITGANFFFINPNGIIFGPNAALNISGSFAASTANYLKLADGARFMAALDADDSGLSSAPVSAFGFLGGNPASIAVQQSALALPNSQALSLVGGDITVDGGVLQAPQGQINVVSVQSAGEVPLDPASVPVPKFNADFPQQGQIQVQNLSQVDASGDGGGRIVIRGGQIVVDNSVIQANTTGTGTGQGIDISALGALNISNGGQINSLTPAGLGEGGNISITAQSVTLDGGGAYDPVTFNPTTQISTSTGDSVSFTGGGPAKAGDIIINATSLELVNSAQISSASFGAGNAGNILVKATSVLLDAMLTTVTQISANAQQSSGGGNAGNITIFSDSLNVDNGAVIAAATFGDGNAGQINITANTLDFSVYGGIAVSTFGSGQGGSIQISAGTLQLDQGGFINAITTGTAFASGPNPDPGKGGDISITANSINIVNTGSIFTRTTGDGNSGNIAITAQNINITGDDGVSGQTTGILASDGDPNLGYPGYGIGNGGNVLINAGALDISGGGKIITSTIGTGNAGTIGINATGVTLEDASSIESASTGSQLGVGLSGGLAGGVTLNVQDTLSLSGQSSISVSSVENDAGDASVTAGAEIDLTDSTISAQAGLNGGNISLKAPSLIYLLNSPLTANARNGNGGVISLDPSFVVLNQSPLTAKVSVQGNGGTVSISSDYFFASQSPFDVSTPSGIPGTVVVTAPNVDLSGVLVALQTDFLDAESQLRPDCAVRLSDDVSTFVLLGRGGMPLEPGGFLPSGMVSPVNEQK